MTMTPERIAEVRAIADSHEPSSVAFQTIHALLNHIETLCREVDKLRNTIATANNIAHQKARERQGLIDTYAIWKEEKQQEIADLQASVDQLRGKLKNAKHWLQLNRGNR